MNINKILFILFAVLFYSCGTIGHVQFYNFNSSKKDVEKDLMEVIQKDSAYVLPAKWNDLYAIKGPVELFYIYFPDSPEEVYQVGFTGDNSQWKNSSICKLSLDGVFDGDKWKFERDLSNKEQRRIKERFETEILSKMKFDYSK